MIRQQITSGQLRPGDRLPSTRALAADLGVSRTTVIAALKRLRAGGWIDSRPGAPVRVRHDPPIDPPPDAVPTETAPHLSEFGMNLATAGREQRHQTPPEIDFHPGLHPADGFPAAEWRRAQSGAWRAAPGDDPMLAQAIQGYLRRGHGIDIDTAQIIVLNGAAQARDLCLRLLLTPGDGVVVADPGRASLRRLLTAHGARIHPLPADDSGMQTDGLAGLSARLAMIASMHHHPLGGTLLAARRSALTRWAEQTGAYVLDDEGDGLFRFDGQTAAPLCPVAPQARSLFLGQFGQVLSGLTDLCFVVVPRGLIEPFCAARDLLGAPGSISDHHALADLLDSGAVERHLRRLRRRLAQTRTAMIAALDGIDGVRVTAPDAGLHMVVWFDRIPASQEQLFCHMARAAGLGLTPLGGFEASGPARERPAAAVMGFSGLSPDRVELGVLRLEKQLRKFRS